MKNQITLSDLEAIAENWYQRTHRLREVWQDETQPAERRAKAGRLWVTMVSRMLNINTILIKAKTPKAPHRFPPGGIIYPKR